MTSAPAEIHSFKNSTLFDIWFIPFYSKVAKNIPYWG